MAGANDIRKPCVVAGCERPIRSGRAEYCETHYYRLRRTGSLEVTIQHGAHDNCQYCGKGTKRKKYCSSRCRARADRGVARTKPCPVCAVVYEPAGRSTVCSAACRIERDRQGFREWRAATKAADPAGTAAKFRAAEYKRKAQKRNAYVEDVQRDEVMRRDGWRCHLCAESIPRRAKWPEPLFGTVDHVLPLALGGAHSYANVRAAHLTCNCKKGARPLGQLGLPLAG